MLTFHFFSYSYSDYTSIIFLLVIRLLKQPIYFTGHWSCVVPSSISYSCFHFHYFPPSLPTFLAPATHLTVLATATLCLIYLPHSVSVCLSVRLSSLPLLSTLPTFPIVLCPAVGQYYFGLSLSPTSFLYTYFRSFICTISPLNQ